MKITIGENKHYPWLIPIGFPIWVSENEGKIRTAKFMFTESCLFDLGNEDQWDVNKLFGFSIGYHHKTSFRFGWRPNLKTQRIEIVAYEYHDGVRQKTMPICEVEIDTWHNFSISYRPISNTSYYFVNEKYLINHPILKRKWGLGYSLGIYFGGNRKAPHKITIFKDKITPD